MRLQFKKKLCKKEITTEDLETVELSNDVQTAFRNSFALLSTIFRTRQGEGSHWVVANAIDLSDYLPFIQRAPLSSFDTHHPRAILEATFAAIQAGVLFGNLNTLEHQLTTNNLNRAEALALSLILKSSAENHNKVVEQLCDQREKEIKAAFVRRALRNDNTAHIALTRECQILVTWRAAYKIATPI